MSWREAWRYGRLHLAEGAQCTIPRCDVLLVLSRRNEEMSAIDLTLTRSSTKIPYPSVLLTDEAILVLQTTSQHNGLPSVYYLVSEMSLTSARA